MTVPIRVLVVFVALLVIGPVAFAETLILKNGQKVEDILLETTDQYLKIRMKDIEVDLTYYLTGIETVEKDVPVVVVKDEAAKVDLIDELK